MSKIIFSNIQPNPKESKIWLNSKGQLTTYNRNKQRWGTLTQSNDRPGELPDEPIVPDEPVIPIDPWEGIANGVYAVNADGNPVNAEDANETCIAVALVNGNHKFMIAKNDASNENGNTAYWGKELKGKSVPGCSTKNGATEFMDKYGTDPTAWTTGPLSDFNGKSSTVAINAAYDKHGISIDPDDMCNMVNMFNADLNYDNIGKNDWYIPSCGQFGVILLNKTEINSVLVLIGGAKLSVSSAYWVSTQYNYSDAFTMSVASNYIGRTGKSDKKAIRFIRDI